MDVSVFIERCRQSTIRSRGPSRLRSIQVHVGVQLASFDSQVSSVLDVTDTEVYRSLKDLAERPCTPRLSPIFHGKSRMRIVRVILT